MTGALAVAFKPAIAPANPVAVPQAPGDRDNTAILDALNAAIAKLASSTDPAAQTIARYLREQDRGLIPFTLGLEGSQGRSIADEVRIAARDRALRKLHASTIWTIPELVAALARYHSVVWPRVLAGPNPHNESSPEFWLFQVMERKPQALSEPRIRAILKRRD